MIWGKTSYQWEQKQARKREREIQGFWTFAWLPKILTDGRFVWLQKVFVQEVVSKIKLYYLEERK